MSDTAELAPDVQALVTQDFEAYQQLRAGKSKPTGTDQGEKPKDQADPQADEPAAKPLKKQADNGDDDEDEPSEPEGKRKESGHARIKRQRDEARAKATELEARLKRLEDALEGDDEPEAKPKETPAQQTAKRPKLSDFDYDEEKYSEALEAWLDTKLNEREEKQKKSQAELSEAAFKKEYEAFHNEHREAYTESEVEARDAHDDYDEVKESLKEVIFTFDANKLLFVNPKFGEIIWQLGQDVDTAEAISALVMSRDAKKHEAGIRQLKKFIASVTEEKPETPKRPVISQAPPPSKTVGARSAPPTTNEEDVLTTSDFSQYEKKRKQMADFRKRAS